jgi:HB1, ASXL, restriction endonuclease HTH domain
VPDRFGFNLLGETVGCIDCDTGGPIWRWPERKRARHARRHHALARRGAANRRRQRVLLAAPLTDTYEEKEAIAMAKQTPTKGEPAKQVALDVLRKAHGPLHAKEIAKRVIATGRCSGLRGKTPEQTITAMLAVGSKPGGPFKRVDKGTYTLADAGTGDAPTDKRESKPRAKAAPKQPETAVT